MGSLRKPSEYERPLCAEIGGDLFFSDDVDTRSTDSLRRFRMAKKICNSCEHIEECARWGLENEVYGIWGGTSPTDRRETRHKRNIKPPVETLYNLNII